MDVLCSGLQAQKDATNKDLDQNQADNFPHDRDALNRFAFLLHWLVQVAEPLARDLNISSGTDKAKRGPGATRAKKVKSDDDWDWVSDRAKAMEIVARLLALDLGRIWISTAEKEAFVKYVSSQRT
jgi:condensin complex subunit 1